MNNIYYYLRGQLKLIYNIGVSRQPDESKQKYIKLINIVSVNTILTNILTGVLFFTLTNFFQGGVISFTCAFLCLAQFFLNAKGFPLAASLYTFIYPAFAILFISSWYSHETKLDQYLLISVTTCNFTFHPKDRLARNFCLFTNLACYIIESTPLQYWLPSLNKIIDLEKTDLILLTGGVFLVVLNALSLSYSNKIREGQLLEKNKQIESAHRAVQIQNDDIQTFSIMASHSLQTPIHVSKHFLNVIKEKATGDDQYIAAKKHIDIILNATDQMSFLVEGLFSYDRIIKAEETYTTFYFIEAMSLIKIRILEKHIGARIEILGGEYQITTNQLLFSIIIQNLVDNGLNYNLSDIKTVKIWHKDEESFTSLFIEDNGIGIEESNFQKIFKPFVRVSALISFNGNGLGLAGAKRAAERLGGQLFCKESSSRGSIFQLNIPKPPK